MKALVLYNWLLRLAYFLGGLALTAICFYISVYTLRNFERGADFLLYLPWIVLIVLIVLRILTWWQIRVGFFFLGIIAFWAILCGYIFFGSDIEDYAHRKTFDAEIWKNQDNTKQDIFWPPRLCMVDNLMSSKRLDGLSRIQVIELLGPPHSKDFPGGAAQCDIHYYLGPERGFIRIDSEWLFIKFDNDEKVQRYWLYRD
jgi:hypothetical protein